MYTKFGRMTILNFYIEKFRIRRGDMPYLNTRRLYHIVGRKISKYFLYRRAKRLYNEITRDLAFVETKILRARNGHA